MKILNLTQHIATAEQRAAGVVDCADSELKSLLTFSGLPKRRDIITAACKLAELANIERSECEMSEEFAVMIGGAPFLMAELERQLKMRGIRALYAFSERASVDVTGPDGTVTKTSQFVHLGFVEAV